jgi:methylated-DNA-protein-cysteine methyltransferase-like protein
MKIVKKEIGKTFSERVVELALMIPKGRVSTYGHIARAAGGGGQAARSVTAILGKAFHTGETRIPFHRIVYAGGRVWLDDGYRAQRLKLYKQEGIELDAKGYIKDFIDTLYEFR